MKAIEARALTKVYKVPKHKGLLRRLLTPAHREVMAVDGIDLDINRGETVGFVGPNGAGKSTTIKMLTGVLVPTQGTVRIKGVDPHRDRLANARSIGVVFGQRSQLWWDLPGRDSLLLAKRIYRIPEKRFRDNLERFDALLSLGDFLDTNVRQMSLGQRMRMDIAAALIHDPDVIYLDEPTIGLDGLVKEKVRQFIESLNRERGTTVIFTTHDMHDIERTCARIVVIDRGQIIYDGALSDFRRKFGGDSTLVVELKDDVEDFHLEGAEIIRAEFRKRWLRFTKEAHPAPKLISELMRRYEVTDFAVQDASIDVIVQRLYQVSAR